jgi:hypothetical protein
MSDTSSVDQSVFEQMQSWANDLLAAGNLPQTPANIEVITGQEIDESGSDTAYNQSGGATNPLDVTNPGNAGQYSPYDSEDAGIQATLQTLQSNDPQYYAALQQGNSLPADISGLGAGTWEGYSSSANESYAGGVSSDIATYFGGQAPAVTTSSGGVQTSKSGKYDWFTSAMIQLNDVMNPKLSASDLITLGFASIVPDTTMLLARGAFAVGFGALGFYALFKSGGKGGLSPLDITGLVAGFVAGPEIGAANALSKLGIKAPSKAGASTPAGSTPANILGQQRLALQAQTSQQKLQLASAKQASQQQIAQQRLTQQAAATQTRASTAHKRTLAQRYSARQRVVAAQTPRVSNRTVNYATTRHSTITHVKASAPPTGDDEE